MAESLSLCMRATRVCIACAFLSFQMFIMSTSCKELSMLST